MPFSCILAGVGGQGTVLASKLIAAAAMERGEFVRTAETIGMAQRGGCVVSHVRVGQEIHSPLVPKGEADLIIGFEPGEAVRCLPYLRKGGAVVASDRPIMPSTVSMGLSDYDWKAAIAYLHRAADRLLILNAERIFAEAGSPKVLNVALLGAAARMGMLEITLEELEAALEKKTPAAYLESNRKALRAGVRVAEREV